MTPPFDIETLVRRHGASLRELAMALVGDANAADDAVQATWVAALQRPPRHDAALGGWFATLLRNVIGGWRRRDRRRLAREHVAAVARGEVTEDHASVIAREELVQRLMAALATLDAPLRDAIWARFFEGKAPRAIAAASGVPVATVKSRLQRGLGMLRMRLGEGDGERDGERGDWRRAFAMAFGIEKGTATATAVAAGGVLMATWIKVTGAIAAAAVAVVLWWPSASTSPTTAPLRDDASGSARAVANLGASDVAAAVGSTPDAPRTAAPLAAGSDAKLATIRGRCVDDKAQPIGDCAISLGGRRSLSDAARAWLRTHDEPVLLEVRASSGVDGRFVLQFTPTPAQFVGVHARSAGRATMATGWFVASEGEVVELGDVEMPLGAQVAGRAVDGDGLPVAGAILSLASKASRAPDEGDPHRVHVVRPDSASTGDTGAFRFAEPAPSDEYTLQPYTVQSLEEFTVTAPRSIELHAERGAVDVLVVLARPAASATITGTALDDEGRPVGGLYLTWQQGAATGRAQTARDGTFVLRCTGPKSSGSVALLLLESVYELRAPLEAEWGARDLALHVVHKPTTSLRVVDCDGMPVNDYRAALVEGSNWGTGDFRSHPILDGRIDLGVHRPGQRVALVEFPRTSGRQPLVESVVISPHGGEITLRAGATASRRLRVQRPDETSVAGVRVQVCEMLGNAFDRSGLVVLDRGKWLVNTSAPRAFVLDETTTDADGATTIRGPVDRALGLRLVDAQSMPLEREDLRFDTGTDLAITLRAGARLRGKITPPAAIDELRRLARAMTAGFAEDRRPSLSFLSQGQRVWPRLNGQRENLRFAIADDGTFDVCGAPVGTWQLALVHWFVLDTGSGTRSLAVSDVTLRAGETCEVAIDLQRILPGGLRAQVFSNGQPLVEQRVMLQRMGGTERAAETPEWAPINTDAEGRFEHRCRPGEYCVELHSGGTRIASAPVTIVRGATIEHAFVLDVGTLQLHVVDAAGQPAASLTVDTHPGQGFGNTDTDGRVAILRSPGECTLRVLPKRLQSPQANASLEAARVKGLSDPYEGVWVLLGTATVLAGQTTKLELRLPPEFEK